MKKISFLIVDSYPLSKRIEFYNNGLLLANQLYRNKLEKYKPDSYNFKYKVLYPSNENFNIYDVNFKKYDLAVITGSSLSIYDKNQQVKNNINLVKTLLNNKIPCFGSCWGMQMLAYLSGGNVMKSDYRELGFGRNITINNNKNIYKDIGNFTSLVSHGDNVVNIDQSSILSYNNHSIQAIKTNIKGIDHYGVQYHPEYNLEYLYQYLNLRKTKFINQNIINKKKLDYYLDGLQMLIKEPNNKELKMIFNINLTNGKEIKNWLDLTLK